MPYTPATKFPAAMRALQFARPDALNPRLDAPINATQTSWEFSAAPLDEAGNPITGNVLGGIATGGYVESVWYPAGSISGAVVTGAVRGVRLTGTDYTTGDSTLAVGHEQDSSVFFNVSAIHWQLLSETITGSLPSGGNNLRTGDLTAADIKRFYSNDQTDKPYDFYDESAQRPRFHMGDDGPSAGLNLESVILIGSTVALAALPELPAGAFQSEPFP